MLGPVERDWGRLAAAVLEGMARRNYATKSAFMKASGLTNKTLDLVLAGEPVSDRTLRRVELALDWPPLTADKILDGGLPSGRGPLGRVREYFVRVESEREQELLERYRQYLREAGIVPTDSDPEPGDGATRRTAG